MRGVKIRPVELFQAKEPPRCAKRLFGTNHAKAIGIGFVAATLATPARCYAQGSPQPASPSFSQVKDFFDPISRILASIAYGLIVAWNYVIDRPPAAVLVSAAIASTVAIVSIRNNRATTKLRETYTKISEANWDEDVIKARHIYSELKDKLSPNSLDIAKFCHSFSAPPHITDPIEIEKLKNEHLEVSGHLRTIMNDYEYIAIGIKMDIIDERFVYSAIRSAVISDWQTLGHMATGYRRKLGNDVFYKDFEKLAAAWELRRSYRTGRKMDQPGWRLPWGRRP
jgi:Domain of unknown function (DUF4760)